MARHSEDKRKNFRFPAYDDDEGVKLTSGPKRKLFEADEIARRFTDDPFGEEKFYHKNRKVNKDEVKLEDLDQPVTQVIKREEMPVKKNWEKPKPKESKEEKKPTFHSEYKPIFSKPQEDKIKRSKGSRIGTGSYQSSVKKYEPPKQFIPSRVPTSLVPKKEVTEPKLDNELIRKKMKKSNASYLLMDTREEKNSKAAIEYSKDDTVSDTAYIPVNNKPHKVIKSKSGREAGVANIRENIRNSQEQTEKDTPFVNKKNSQESDNQ